ncbi:ORF MSV182 hypothetical protein [Melanoplus sanguinipes entomopoxvirus]|uniref:Uncharacterized protein n=1 Tax=Melanoplus sanguinipes entomopoxvirus TaxID=83191 RepID=Q9YVR0_MSEPV|nr:ORF MSV182 hypothetical protein [Melanoplus sanguinipes entomopoxvirus]AAC97769.1 ORF MSV182 hypothetical protein [Melanoplus sanguinipes entomopoxvirus 'O']
MKKYNESNDSNNILISKMESYCCDDNCVKYPKKCYLRCCQKNYCYGCEKELQFCKCQCKQFIKDNENVYKTYIINDKTIKLKKLDYNSIYLSKFIDDNSRYMFNISSKHFIIHKTYLTFCGNDNVNYNKINDIVKYYPSNTINYNFIINNKYINIDYKSDDYTILNNFLEYNSYASKYIGDYKFGVYIFKIKDKTLLTILKKKSETAKLIDNLLNIQ